MSEVSRKVYINNLNDIVDSYKNTYYRTIKIRQSDIESSSSIYFDAKNGYKDPEFTDESLFEAIELTKKFDSDKIFYAGYGIAFGACYLYHCLLLANLVKT